jgi:ubiquinone/menaquinone biosynthesis C-methylase UbiE
LAYGAFDGLRQWLNRRLVNHLAAVLPAQGCRILEAGSGPAFASQLFSQRQGIRLSVAADIDMDPLRQAQAGNTPAALVVADVYRLPFRSRAFDLVWNSSTLEHLVSPQAALAEMKRVAKDGGYVFVGTPYRFGPLAFQPLIRNTPLGIWIGPVFSRTELMGIFRSEGLIAESSRTYFFGVFLGVVGRKIDHNGGNGVA